MRNLVLDNYTMKLRIQDKTLLCKIAKIRERGDNSKSITLESPLWEKLLMLRHSTLGVPTI
jgi:hypothetical protein